MVAMARLAGWYTRADGEVGVGGGRGHSSSGPRPNSFVIALAGKRVTRCERDIAELKQRLDDPKR
jgi:hypothetical protein